MTKYTVLIMFSLALVLSGCFQDRKSEVTEVPETPFAIYLYRYENGYSETADYVINDEDIVRYEWSQQTLVLNSSLKRLYETDNKFLRDPSRFIVTLDDEPIFQGEVMFIGSERRLSTPLIYVLEDDMFPGYGNIFPEYASEDEFLRIQFRTPFDVRSYPQKATFPVDDPIIQEQISQHFLGFDKLLE